LGSKKYHIVSEGAVREKGKTTQKEGVRGEENSDDTQKERGKKSEATLRGKSKEKLDSAYSCSGGGKTYGRAKNIGCTGSKSLEEASGQKVWGG